MKPNTHQRRAPGAAKMPGDGLKDFYCAGYLLIRTANIPNGLDTRPLLTKDVTSVCECIYPRFPDVYAVEWTSVDEDDRSEGFEDMGVPKNLREKAIDYATDTFEAEHGAWGVFFNLDAARAAYERFLKKSSGIRLIGLGVRRDDAAEFIKANAPPPPEPGYAPWGLSGQMHVLQKMEPLADGGRLLGFEPLVTWERIVGCSWLCNGLEELAKEELGITPNKLGLLKSYDDARRITDRINKGDIGAEPGVWMPWALVEYATSSRE